MPRTARQSARRLPAVALAAVLAATTLAGCSSTGEKLTEAAIKKSDSSIKDVDIDDEGFSIQSEDGSISGGSNAELPDGFPDDVPLPEGDATITTAVTQGDEIAVMYTVVDADLDAEKERIADELTSGGYEVGDQSSTQSAGLTSFSLSAVGKGKQVTVTYVRSDGEDTQVMYAVKPEA